MGHKRRVSDTGRPEPLPPGLYIVATPIGNLGDVTRRSADVLSRCDAVACEDTRVTGKLLKHLGISRPLWRYDDHSAAEDRARLLDSLRGKAVALVSDAGTPLISDPGYKLVREAKEARAEMLAELSGVRATLVFFDTAPRLAKSLEAIGEVLPGREVAVARELTKLYEECRTGTAAELAAHYAAHPPKGEIVLMVGPPGEKATSEADADALLRAALASEKPSQAAGQVAKATGLDRKALYARALELRGE